jgi:16S rRNA C1402 (ribose-2'-O) methylase RsmI
MEDGNNGEVKKLIGAAHSACPELFLPDGGVDVYRVASRYQELANARRKFLETVAEKDNVDDLLARVIEYSYIQKYDQKQEGSVRGTLAEIIAHFKQTEPRGEIVVVVAGCAGVDISARKALKEQAKEKKPKISNKERYALREAAPEEFKKKKFRNEE